jgi:hypothetical protein
MMRSAATLAITVLAVHPVAVAGFSLAPPPGLRLGGWASHPGRAMQSLQRMRARPVRAVEGRRGALGTACQLKPDDVGAEVAEPAVNGVLEGWDKDKDGRLSRDEMEDVFQVCMRTPTCEGAWRPSGYEGAWCRMNDGIDGFFGAKDLGGWFVGIAATAGVVGASYFAPGAPPTLPIILTFLVGYAAIIFEGTVSVNKGSLALIMGIASWSLLGHTGLDGPERLERLEAATAEISEIVFFLIGAMAIVETVDVHEGFELITARIATTDTRVLLALLTSITFVLSAVLDNLTTTIIMISLLKKLIGEEDKELRLTIGGLLVIAANAGGAWSPLGYALHVPN